MAFGNPCLEIRRQHGLFCFERCRIESLEHTARIIYLAESLGGSDRLTPEQIGDIFKVYGHKTSPRIREAGRKMSEKD